MQEARIFLQALALLHVAGGLLLPWLVPTGLAAPYLAYLNTRFPAASAEQATFLLGLFGPTVASWGVLFFFLVGVAFRHPSRQLWWGMVLACLVWAPYDAFLSSLHGVYWNVGIDAIVLSALLIPLWCVREEFQGK